MCNSSILNVTHIYRDSLDWQRGLLRCILCTTFRSGQCSGRGDQDDPCGGRGVKTNSASCCEHKKLGTFCTILPPHIQLIQSKYLWHSW